jgi:hypothetical protein
VGRDALLPGTPRRGRAFRLRDARPKVNEALLAFRVKPGDGLDLPKIMQWIKQAFPARINVLVGRTGNVWGDRYWLDILDGEPPEGAKAVDWAAVEMSAKTPMPADTAYTLTWDSPRRLGVTLTTVISLKNATDPASPPG